jgi:hypothetical protein
LALPLRLENLFNSVNWEMNRFRAHSVEGGAASETSAGAKIYPFARFAQVNQQQPGSESKPAHKNGLIFAGISLTFTLSITALNHFSISGGQVSPKTLGEMTKRRCRPADRFRVARRGITASERIGLDAVNASHLVSVTHSMRARLR